MDVDCGGRHEIVPTASRAHETSICAGSPHRGGALQEETDHETVDLQQEVAA